MNKRYRKNQVWCWTNADSQPLNYCVSSSLGSLRSSTPIINFIPKVKGTAAGLQSFILSFFNRSRAYLGCMFNSQNLQPQVEWRTLIESQNRICTVNRWLDWLVRLILWLMYVLGGCCHYLKVVKCHHSRFHICCISFSVLLFSIVDCIWLCFTFGLQQWLDSWDKLFIVYLHSRFLRNACNTWPQ